MDKLTSFRILFAPLLGCIIGYITNDLAIKMLFRPRKSIYIGKLHIPFTPGLIPQQKDRIAVSIGRVISMQLLNSKTIKQTILSDKTLLAIKDKIQISLKQYKNDTRTLNQVLEGYIEPRKIETYKMSVFPSLHHRGFESRFDEEFYIFISVSLTYMGEMSTPTTHWR